MTTLEILHRNLELAKEMGKDILCLKKEQEQQNITTISERIMREFSWNK